MKIGCLQFAPEVGDVGNNLNRADDILNKAQNIEDIDLLVLPELAFTGYNFRSLSEISPFLEHSGRGISALWAQTTALRLNCNVIVGYPETVDVSHKWPASPEFYNAAIVVSKDGETIGNYRKSFLYAVDETWALEGQDGFFEGHIDGLGDVAMGICNPYKFEAPWHNFEFAFHALEIKANLVIVTMAWLTREGAETISEIPQEPDFQTLEYWVQRLEPLIRRGSREEIVVVFCNRCGIEGDAVYAGTSSVIGIKNGEVNIYGVLGRGLKEVLVVDTNNPPLAKLLRTSHGRRPGAAESDGYDSNQSIAGSSPNVSRKSTPFPPRQAFHPFRGDSASEGHDGGAAQGTQNEDADDAWEVMSTSASHGSAPSLYSHSGAMPPRNQMPRLELQIPYSAGTAGSLSKLKDSLHATQNQEGKPPAVVAGDVLTPTAPSPTPMSQWTIQAHVGQYGSRKTDFEQSSNWSQSTNSSSSWLLGTPPLAHTQLPLDPGDEIIAMINVIRNGCPTHDSRAPSLEPQSQRQTMKHDRSQSQTQNRSQAQGQGQDPRQSRQSSQQRERPVWQQHRQGTTGTRVSNQQQPQSQQLLLQQQQHQQQQQRHPSQAPTAQGDNAQEPIYEIILPPHLRELVETMSSPDPRAESATHALDSKRQDRAAPKFNPPTPTAMKFDTNEEEGTPAAA
ncbi:hypothetical protein HMPREF1624_07846 [Sporothrix schenckii ATCC 58251]|uniref:CN hydrolase domain-containing protein n=1 Tax=Sporothrix schenckii (strain ATCC 58251 / de Perez 2211183) TaxID=1391915 RepID=U7PLF4_SPOS1|nr:hypothetical protein HMPREF1624_07846 [Sporothrix schenckii ATCC 58251]